jgi:hypothetical protein
MQSYCIDINLFTCQQKLYDVNMTILTCGDQWCKSIRRRFIAIDLFSGQQCFHDTRVPVLACIEQWCKSIHIFIVTVTVGAFVGVHSCGVFVVCPWLAGFFFLSLLQPSIIFPAANVQHHQQMTVPQVPIAGSGQKPRRSLDLFLLAEHGESHFSDFVQHKKYERTNTKT